MFTNRKLPVLFILALAVFATACPNRTSIGKINADPGRYRDKQVAVAGRVTDSYGVLDTGAYQIDDGTGALWVVTRRGVPSRGARVGATGRVYSGVNVGGRSFGIVLEEQDRRAR